MKLAAIILAAGGSQRFGSNKFKFKINNQELIRLTVQPFINHIHINPVMVITGKYHEELEDILKHTGVILIYNSNWEDGMSSSIIKGLEYFEHNQIKKLDGLFIHPGDIPRIDNKVLCDMIKNFTLHFDKIIIPKYNDKRGHPILIPHQYFNQVLQINEQGEGMKTLLKHYSNEIVYVPSNNPGILIDVDTLNDIEKLNSK